LSVLTETGYVPDEPGIVVDGFLHRRAELLYKDGDPVGTAALIRRIVNPGSLVEISLDPRFRAMLPADFDLRRSVEQALAGARTDAARHPDLLSPTIEVATYLRVLGKPQEAIAALEALRPRIDDPAAFGDRADRLVWWWDGLSRAHAMLGHYPEAVDALRKGGQAEENGGLNVSQVINLSALQLKLGRPAETLATLAAFDDGKRGLSPYGTMQIAVNRGCATAALGKPSDVGADLTYARTHVADAPDALFDLLLCVGDLDGATTALLAQLGNPDRRAAALRVLSDYDDPPVALPPDPTDAALRQVKARPEVRAAIMRAGGTRRFHVQNVSF
jgi:tetratricopeptide (TPR) repeat protein